MDRTLSYSDLLKLKRWNTPTIYNGWEAITSHDTAKGHFNMEETRDFMPQMGSMIGYAITVVHEPSNPDHPKNNPNAWKNYLEYVASMPGPKIVVVQDLDKPNYVAAFWGEVCSNMHKALGCVGTITDGGIRDIDEMCNAGFKAIAKRACVGHAFSTSVRCGCEVEIFGCSVKPGQLIHADKHGFLVIPDEDQKKLLDASIFMDCNECNTLISASRSCSGKSTEEILKSINNAQSNFKKAVAEKFKKQGEW